MNDTQSLKRFTKIYIYIFFLHISVLRETFFQHTVTQNYDNCVWGEPSSTSFTAPSFIHPYRDERQVEQSCQAPQRYCRHCCFFSTPCAKRHEPFSGWAHSPLGWHQADMDSRTSSWPGRQSSSVNKPPRVHQGEHELNNNGESSSPFNIDQRAIQSQRKNKCNESCYYFFLPISSTLILSSPTEVPAEPHSKHRGVLFESLAQNQPRRIISSTRTWPRLLACRLDAFSGPLYCVRLWWQALFHSALVAVVAAV